MNPTVSQVSAPPPSHRGARTQEHDSASGGLPGMFGDLIADACAEGALKCAELQQKGFTLLPGSRVYHICSDVVPIQSLLKNNVSNP